MKNIYGFAILLLLSLVFGQTTQAQSPASILKKAAKAMGGEKALRSVRSWQATGKISRLSDGAAGGYQAQAQQPNFYSASYDLNGFESAVGYNGKSGWMRDSQDGLRTLTGGMSKDFQAEAVYRASRWLNYKQDKAKISSGGQANVNSKTANVVSLTTAKGVQIKMYFDAATGLLVREEIPAGNSKQIFDYSDFRAVNGVQEPFAIAAIIGDDKYEIKLDKITHNVNQTQTAFDFPKISNEPLPDIKTLFDEIRANAEKVDEILENYSYTATSTAREIDKSGKLIEKDSEAISFTFYKGYRITRQVAKNGKPLSPADQADEDKKVEKQVAEIEKRIAEKERKQQKERDVSASSTGTPNEEGGQNITIADALRGSLLVNPRRERLRGRDVIVFDYEPNPAFKPQTRLERVFALCNGAVWVDANDKQVVRLEANLSKTIKQFGGLASLKRGASFSLEQERVNNEIWLPSIADINLSVKILFGGINVNQLVKYGDYRKFSTEIKDARVDEIKENQ